MKSPMSRLKNPLHEKNGAHIQLEERKSRWSIPQTRCGGVRRGAHHRGDRGRQRRSPRPPPACPVGAPGGNQDTKGSNGIRTHTCGWEAPGSRIRGGCSTRGQSGGHRWEEEDGGGGVRTVYKTLIPTIARDHAEDKLPSSIPPLLPRPVRRTAGIFTPVRFPAGRSPTMAVGPGCIIAVVNSFRI